MLAVVVLFGAVLSLLVCEVPLLVSQQYASCLTRMP